MELALLGIPALLILVAALYGTGYAAWELWRGFSDTYLKR